MPLVAVVPLVASVRLKVVPSTVSFSLAPSAKPLTVKPNLVRVCDDSEGPALTLAPLKADTAVPENVPPTAVALRVGASFTAVICVFMRMDVGVAV